MTDTNEVVGGAIVSVVALFLLSILGVLTYKFFAADGKADYCFLQRTYGQDGATSLHQHVPWGSDRPIGNYPSMPAALEAAALLKCEVK